MTIYSRRHTENQVQKFPRSHFEHFHWLVLLMAQGSPDLSRWILPQWHWTSRRTQAGHRRSHRQRPHVSPNLLKRIRRKIEEKKLRHSQKLPRLPQNLSTLTLSQQQRFYQDGHSLSKRSWRAQRSQRSSCHSEWWTLSQAKGSRCWKKLSRNHPRGNQDCLWKNLHLVLAISLKNIHSSSSWF